MKHSFAFFKNGIWKETKMLGKMMTQKKGDKWMNNRNTKTLIGTQMWHKKPHKNLFLQCEHGLPRGGTVSNSWGGIEFGCCCFVVVLLLFCCCCLFYCCLFCCCLLCVVALSSFLSFPSSIFLFFLFLASSASTSTKQRMKVKERKGKKKGGEQQEEQGEEDEAEKPNRETWKKGEQKKAYSYKEQSIQL